MSYQRRQILCGKPTCSRWHGPYWYAFWWDGGKTRCKYIGKTLPAELEASRVRTDAPALVASVPDDPTDAPTE